MKKHIGIDYGAKLAGTTAICFTDNEQLHFAQSIRQKDADKMIEEQLAQLNPALVYIDAPLSLPKAYKDQGSDFFYRLCDRELKAMSPMFLGGLTARAMQLRSKCQHLNCAFHETYPAALAKYLSAEADREWKQDRDNFEPFLKILTQQLPCSFAEKPANWHQVDAALAWLSGYRHLQGKAITVGDSSEGLIIY